MDVGRTEGIAVLRELEVELTSSLDMKINKKSSFHVGGGKWGAEI